MTLGRTPPLVTWTSSGLYCPLGDFYVDPHRAVPQAIITHAHSDHARRGSQQYMCASSGVGLLKSRLGKKIQVQGIDYQKRFQIGKVQVSFHSAGHILGSAQIRIQYGADVWVVSGDYKREADPSCDPFEVVTCDTFITEATFGTPQFVWKREISPGNEISAWWHKNALEGKNSVLLGYSLGKTQRILAELAPYAQRPILIHSTMVELTECYRREGKILAPTQEWTGGLFQNHLRGELILTPPSMKKDLEELKPYEIAFASGWMQGGNQFRQNYFDRGFVISDHADWKDLNRTVEETGAQQVFVLHRSNGAFIRHLRKRGIQAYPIFDLQEESYSRLPDINLSLFR